jgi:aldehyde:ferredoxin oxidoreductase
MKNIIIVIALIAITAAACNNNSNTSEKNKDKDDTTQVKSSSTNKTGTYTMADAKNGESMRAIVSQYLQIKNALANDNGGDAARAGNTFVTSMEEMEKASLTPEKKKIWDDISDDAKEMAKHIGDNADKLEHQRQHFDMLSKDIYDLVKEFRTGQTLYKDSCPMYNNSKGAIWLSETVEIKNPYLGKKMPACGAVKEEIK